MEHVKCDGGRWQAPTFMSRLRKFCCPGPQTFVASCGSQSFSLDGHAIVEQCTSNHVTRAQRFSCPRTSLVLCTVHSASPSPEVFTGEVCGGAVSHCPCVQTVLLYMECSILCSEVSKNYKLTFAISCPLSNWVEQSLDKLMVAQSGRSSR
jgi:hypothetical protein